MTGEGLVQQRLFQRLQRGELALVEGFEALGFVRGDSSDVWRAISLLSFELDERITLFSNRPNLNVAALRFRTSLRLQRCSLEAQWIRLFNKLVV